MAKSCLHIVIKESKNDRIIYLVQPYKYKVNVNRIAYVPEAPSSYFTYVDSTDSLRDNLDYRYEYEELVLTSEQKRRLEEVNNIIASDTSVNLSSISNHILEISSYVMDGYISPKTNSKVLMPLAESASSLTRFMHMTDITSWLKTIRKDKVKEGVAFKGMVFDSDATSVSAVGSLVISFMAGINTSISYKTKDGKFYTIDSLEKCKELYNVLYTHVQACFKAESLSGIYYSGLNDHKLEDEYAELSSANISNLKIKFNEFYTKAVQDLKGVVENG